MRVFFWRDKNVIVLDAAAQTSGRSLGEWCREVLLASGQESKPAAPVGAEVQAGFSNAIMAELVALRAILLNLVYNWRMGRS